MRKKLAAFFTAAAALVNSLVFNAAADDKSLKLGLDYNTGTLKEGETVTVSVSITDNPGISGWMIGIGYNSSAFELDSYTVGVFGDKTETTMDPDSTETFAGPVVFFYSDLASQKDITASGVVGTATFKVKDTAPEGDYSFTLDYSQNNFFDVYQDRIQVSQGAVQTGTVFVPCSHDLEFTEAIASTCIEQGRTGYYYCTRCERYYSDSSGENEVTLSELALPYAAHKFTAEVPSEENLKEAASCSAGAVYYKTCEVCGAKGEETFVFGEPDASKHNYVREVVPPFGKAEGYYIYTCSECGGSYSEELPEGTQFRGDANGDGKVNRVDLLVLTRRNAKWEGYEEMTVSDNCDINNDTRINRIDQMILARYLAGWEGYSDYITVAEPSADPQ